MSSLRTLYDEGVPNRLYAFGELFSRAPDGSLPSGAFYAMRDSLVENNLMISIEQVRSLLSMEQLENHLQQKPQGAPAGIVAGEQVKDSRSREWGYCNVIAQYLAERLGIERIYVDYSCVWIVGEAHPFDFDPATWEWVETLLMLLDDVIAGNEPMCRVISREQVLALFPFVRAKVNVSAKAQ